MAICSYAIDQCQAPEIVDIVSNHRFILIKRNEKWEFIDNTGHRWLKELKSMGSSYAEIGRKLGLSRERVRQIIGSRPVTLRNDLPDHQMLKISKAAKFLNIHVNTLRRWSDQGILPCYRFGSRGDRKYSRSDLIDFRRQNASYRAN